MEGNIIKNKIVTVSETLSNETLLKLNMLLNTNLNGMAIEEINLGMIARLKEQAGIHSEVISDVLDAVANTIQLDKRFGNLYKAGATNIFKYPVTERQSKRTGDYQCLRGKATARRACDTDTFQSGEQRNSSLYRQ